MNNHLQILNIASPLLLITIAALISEYAGRMAMFLDGIINLGAFLFYTFAVKTGLAFPSILISVLLCTLMIFIAERIASLLHGNMFLVSLALNIFCSALVTLLSAQIFGTRGVLYSPDFKFDPVTARIYTSIICLGISIITIIILKNTRLGLSIRISGSDTQVLDGRGISSDAIKSLSWCITAAFGAFVGCSMALRLSSFVPGMSGGRGWTALAAVFLGKKNPLLVLLAVIVFALCEYLSTYIQNISFFANMPSSILLSLPYLIALLLIIIIPKRK